jgi:DNA-directed RNA polymerase specialized sigma24 family protein
VPSDIDGLLATHGAAIDRAIAVVCHRADLNADQAEDLAQETWTHVLGNDCEAIRRFQGRCAAATYFVKIATTVLVGLRRRRDGRWRPSRPLRRLGPIATELEALIVRDRFTPHEAVEFVRSRWTASEAELELIVELLLTSCHRRRRPLVASGLRTVNPQVDISISVDPEQLLLEKELAASHLRVVRTIRTAWRLLASEDRRALAGRSVWDSRNPSPQGGSSRARFRRAGDRLRGLLASAGVDWHKASAALQHDRLDLGLPAAVSHAIDIVRREREG